MLDDGESSVLEGFDTIILAMGCEPYNPLQVQLEGKVAELVVVGDAKEARQAIDATWEGANAALSL